MRFFSILILFLASLCPFSSSAQLIANAGPDFTLCPAAKSVLGSSVPATGGTPPYVFNWSPSVGLSSTTVANPTITGVSSQTYVLDVSDKNDNHAYDTVVVTVPDLSVYTAGSDVRSCAGKTITIGNPNNNSASGVTFIWSPAAGLSSPTLATPAANPSVSTVYTLTVTKGSCSLQTGTVFVDLQGLPLGLNFQDTTIYEGVTITLISSAQATSYDWFPKYMIKYDYTNAPDVSPIHTTVYTVFAIDANGCLTHDTVRVNVIPSDEPVFYSAFTPNGDGNNDFFFIGNVQKFPDNILKIYNRYGQVIYTAAGYNNDWDGSYQGNKVPTGTYFYIFDTGTERGQYKGSITILR